MLLSKINRFATLSGNELGSFLSDVKLGSGDFRESIGRLEAILLRWNQYYNKSEKKQYDTEKVYRGYALIC